MRLVERKPTELIEIRVKPHPICPHCNVVCKPNGRPSHSPRVSYYKCPIRGCGFTTKLFDAFRTMSNIRDTPGP